MEGGAIFSMGKIIDFKRFSKIEKRRVRGFEGSRVQVICVNAKSWNVAICLSLSATLGSLNP